MKIFLAIILLCLLTSCARESPDSAWVTPQDSENVTSVSLTPARTIDAAVITLSDGTQCAVATVRGVGTGIGFTCNWPSK